MFGTNQGQRCNFVILKLKDVKTVIKELSFWYFIEVKLVSHQIKMLYL